MILASSIISSISLPATTFAATADTATPEQQADAFIYFRSLQACLYQGNIFNRIGGNYSSGYISTQDANGGAWFKSAHKRALSRGNGIFYDCGDSDWIQKMISLYGYGSGGEMLLAIGLQRNSDADYTAKFQDQIARDLGGNIAKKWGKEPNLDGAASYAFFTRLFVDKGDGCGATPTNDAGIADSNKGVRITKMLDPATGKVTPDGQNTAFAYKEGVTGTDEVAAFNEGKGGYKSFTCRQIAQNISNNAEAAAMYYLAHPDQKTSMPDPTGGASAGQTDKTNKVTCAVEAIGWIVCPVVNVMSKITDQAYRLVSALLVVQPLVTTGGAGSLYEAWTKMRNIANILFAIAFIIIMYSQITSMGVNNYGIKKLLPKLIVCAILVNVSFWLCAIAVDISNVAGSSLNGIFGSQLPTGPYDSVITQGNGWTGLAVSILGATAIVYAGLSILLPALIMVLVIIVTVFVGLILRQSLIILLIVISPIAIVAYLLPNTEGLFKKWRDMFKALLIVYPVIGLLFGASALASAIIMTSAADIKDPIIKIAVQTAGAAAQIMPLILIKTIISGATSLIQRVTGVVNNPNKGPFDRMRKGADRIRERQENRRSIRAMNNGRVFGGSRFRRNARREAIDQGIKQQKNIADAGYVADKAEKDTSFRNQIAGGTSLNKATDAAGRAALANAINVQAKLTADQVNATKAVIENLNLPFNDLATIAMGGNSGNLSGADETTRRAAIQIALKKSTVDDAESIIKSSGLSRTAYQDIADGLVSSGLTNKATHLGGKTLDDIAQGKIKTDNDLDDSVMDHMNKGKYSAETIVNQDADSMKRVAKIASAGVAPDGTTLDPTVKLAIKKAASQVITDPRLKSRINSKISGDNIEIISKL